MTLQEEGASIIYGLEFPARALCSVQGGIDDIAFLVGTQALRDENQIHWLRLDSTGALDTFVYTHECGEVWQLAGSPDDSQLFSSCYTSVSGVDCTRTGAVWRLPPRHAAPHQHQQTDPSALQRITDLHTDENLCSIQWCTSDGSKLMGVAERKLVVWDLNVSGYAAKICSEMECAARRPSRLAGGKWNPHQSSTQLVTHGDTTVRCHDLRSSKQCWSLEHAHSDTVRDLDFNPFNQYLLATCGDDCMTRVWDIRKPTQALKDISVHSHWVWSIRYNPFHDQLLLSGSGDWRVHLSALVSLSSEPRAPLLLPVTDDEEVAEELQQQHPEGEQHRQQSDSGDGCLEESSEKRIGHEDRMIGSYDEHEDSVYAVEWSSADAWTFASLSYDGRVVIRTLSDNIRHSILT